MLHYPSIKPVKNKFTEFNMQNVNSFFVALSLFQSVVYGNCKSVTFCSYFTILYFNEAVCNIACWLGEFLQATVLSVRIQKLRKGKGREGDMCQPSCAVLRIILCAAVQECKSPSQSHIVTIRTQF